MDDCQISGSDFVFYEQLRILDCEVFFALFPVLEGILLLECSYRTWVTEGISSTQGSGDSFLEGENGLEVRGCCVTSWPCHMLAV